MVSSLYKLTTRFIKTCFRFTFILYNYSLLIHKTHLLIMQKAPWHNIITTSYLSNQFQKLFIFVNHFSSFLHSTCTLSIIKFIQAQKKGFLSSNKVTVILLYNFKFSKYTGLSPFLVKHIRVFFYLYIFKIKNLNLFSLTITYKIFN